MTMLRVSVESIVKNIFIVDDNIYFEDNRGLIVKHPANRYKEGTDSYEAAETFLFNDEYLNFNDEGCVTGFKDYCIDQHKKDIYIFNWKYWRTLKVAMDYIDDPVAEDEDVLMMKLKEYCIK